jgi:chromosomal replication initiator protein
MELPTFAIELPLPADMPLEEKAAVLLALVPTVGLGRFRRLLLITAKAFDISVRDLRGPSRLHQHVVPRQIAMTIAILTFGVSLPAVGAAFGGRDHTTVMHARNKFGSLIRELTGGTE